MECLDVDGSAIDAKLASIRKSSVVMLSIPKKVVKASSGSCSASLDSGSAKTFSVGSPDTDLARYKKLYLDGNAMYYLTRCLLAVALPMDFVMVGLGDARSLTLKIGWPTVRAKTP